MSISLNMSIQVSLFYQNVDGVFIKQLIKKHVGQQQKVSSVIFENKTIMCSTVNM